MTARVKCVRWRERSLWMFSQCVLANVSSRAYPYLSVLNGCFHKKQGTAQFSFFLFFLPWVKKESNQTKPYECCTKGFIAYAAANHKDCSDLQSRRSQQTSGVNRKSFPFCKLGSSANSGIPNNCV